MTSLIDSTPVSTVPKHVAIIMDGNGRWAAQRGMPRIYGHRAGIKALKSCVDAALNTPGVDVATVYALSCENIARPQEEVAALMMLFEQTIQKELNQLHEKNIKLKFIGDMSGLPSALVSATLAAEQLTQHNTALTLNIAINYSGQWHIAHEVVQLIGTAATQMTATECMALLDQRLSLEQLPVDLVIRTSGEQRLSNFLLWQVAYAELYFTDCYWPDFDEVEFAQALEAYAQRQRRFGRLVEQKSAAI